MECCYVVLPPEKHWLSSDRFYRERRSMGKWRSTMTFLGNMLNEEFDETTRNWWQIQCWKPMDSSREWLWYFLNLGMYSWGYIYIYHQLSIVVGSEKGGYLSSWLWHVMNLWTFNRKQDDRNHPHVRWDSVRLTWRNLARPSDSMNPWEQRPRSWEPNQTGCISRWNNMIITLR